MPSLFPLVFPPSPFLSVVVVVVDARTFAVIGVPLGSVGVGALVERDAAVVETVDRAE